MVKIIAELGSNPAPGWDLREYIESAALCGADAVKVQLWKPDHFPEAERAEKIARQFPRERFGEFVRLVHKHEMEAGASAFDEEAAAMLMAADFGKKALREIGNSSLVNSLYHYGISPIYESRDVFGAWRGGICDDGRIIGLGAIGQYPTPLAVAMWGLLRWAKNMRHASKWGWSSHTANILDCVWAARLGASVIEKHFALHKTDCEAGHSLLPADFARMTEKIKWSV